MKKIAIALAAVLMMIAPTAQATSQEVALPSGDVFLIKTVFNNVWRDLDYSDRQAICRGFYVIPSKTVSIIARPTIQSGMFNPWMVKRVIRNQLAKKC